MGWLSKLFGGKGGTDLGVRHTIKVLPRETVRSIAQREYGDESKWEIIFNKNKWRFDGQTRPRSIPAWISIFPRSKPRPNKRRSRRRIKPGGVCAICIGAVPKVGIEPTRGCPHWFLRPARLPIPPLRRMAGVEGLEPPTDGFGDRCSTN